MRGLHQTLQFIGSNHGHIAPGATAHYDDLPVVDSAIHERLKLLSGFAIGSFNGDGGFFILGQGSCTSQ